MGIYINPRGDLNARSKRDTILNLSHSIGPGEFLKHNPGERGQYGIALVDNGLFIAAGVAFSKVEARVFVEHVGPRPVEYCLLTIDQIEQLDSSAAAALKQITAQAEGVR